MGQIWATSSLGGYMAAQNLSKRLRFGLAGSCKCRQFAEAKDAQFQAKKKGDVFHWDVYKMLATRGGTLTETNTMPTSNFTIVQGTLTVTEAGIAVPYSGKLEMLSEHDLQKIVDKPLRNDAKQTLDALAFNALKETPLRVTAATSTTTVTLATNGTPSETNTIALDKEHIGPIVDVMKERNIPPYIGDDYYCLSHPTTFRGMKNDLEGVRQYTQEGYREIKWGELGRYENVRFLEQTNIPKGGAADSTTFNALTNTADAWNQAKSSWALFIGEDAITEGVTQPEEVRAKIPTDYGRSKGIAWYYLGGFGLVHTDEAEARVVMWDSAV